MKPRLLLVEDNFANLRLLQDWLESEDFLVDIAENLDTARAAVLAAKPELVLLDVRLGAEDGLDLVRWLRMQEGCSQVPVIAVTAHALRHEQEHIMAQGCNAIMSKPIDFRVLRRQIDFWLNAARILAAKGELA